MFEMTISSKDGKLIRRVELSGRRPVRIGRSHECEVQVALAAVSRQHAIVAPIDGDTWVIRDLGSTHGCLVKGEPIRELTVRPGLEVQIGPAVIKFDDLTTRIGAELDRLIPDEEEVPAASSGSGMDLAATTVTAGDSGAPVGESESAKKGKKRQFFKLSKKSPESSRVG